MSFRRQREPGLGRSPSISIESLIAFVCAALVVANLWDIRQDRAAAFAQATIDTRNLSRSILDHATDTVQAADVAMVGLVARLNRNTDDPTRMQRIRENMVQEVERSGGIRGLFFFDKNGDLVMSSLPDGSPPLNNRDRDHFKFHEANDTAELHIGAPFHSKIFNVWLIPLSRRVTAPDGGFGGVLVATLDTDFFAGFFKKLELGTHGVVGLYIRPGVLLSRLPIVEADLGRDFSDQPLMREQVGREPSGDYDRQSPIDGIVRLGSYDTGPRYPLVVTVAMAKADVFAEWRHRAIWQTVVVAGIVLGASILGLMVIIQIRGRQRAERAIRTQNGQMKAILDNMPDGVLLLDEQGRLVSLNAQALEILDLDPALARAPDPARAMMRQLAERGDYGAGATEDVVSREFERCAAGDFRTDRRPLPNGRWAELRNRGIESGGHVCLIRDVTDEVTCEQVAEQARIELMTAREQAEAANIAKSEFLANMSHEIRTPMNGIIGMTGLLMRTPLADDQRRFGEAIQVSSEALLSIINDILDISKLEAGKVDLEHIPFDLARVVEDAVELMAARAHEQGLEIAAHVAGPARRWFMGDPTRLRQILLNLLSNAVKFTPAGHVSIAVAADERPDGTWLVRVEVADTGIGLGPEAKAVLFRKFQQADGSITRRFGGTGLGLSISKELIDLMHGRIGTDDRPVGTQFWFEVALDPAAPDSAQARPTLAALAGLKVLVVDDLPINLTILGESLVAEGLAVETATGGVEALAMVERAAAEGAPYALVLLDHVMPDLSGEAVADAIRSRPEVPPKLVLVSSVGGAMAPAAGFDAFLTKPLRHAALLDMVRCVFAVSGAVPCGPVELLPQPVQRAGRILVADDNMVNQMLAQEILESIGYSVDVVDSGQGAVAAVQAARYDLVLMDVQMPGMDGYEATRLIQALGAPVADVPIVAVTANAMTGDKETCLTRGMIDYLPKPFTPDAMIVVVDRWMGMKADGAL